jgi:anaerobic selenocysteine-containing dehydrogenase
VGEVVVTVEVTDAVMPGSVCMPHGFGHDLAGTALRLASSQPGASFNDLSDDAVVESLSSTAVFNGIPVTVARC